ncbi:hypothetical protein HID58_000934 [Brassica napus]|uniref:NYN domain-containing protein n=1 Tax=Brassica napus TaxID=3708 RepID=A0ABQ8EHY4_BRANA|nr:hypothetical protein HID58_000934 [Brassica napus]
MNLRNRMVIDFRESRSPFLIVISVERNSGRRQDHRFWFRTLLERPESVIMSKVPSNPDTVLVNGLWDKENADLPIGYPIESLVSFINTALKQHDSRFMLNTLTAYGPNLPSERKHGIDYVCIPKESVACQAEFPVVGQTRIMRSTDVADKYLTTDLCLQLGQPEKRPILIIAGDGDYLSCFEEFPDSYLMLAEPKNSNRTLRVDFGTAMWLGAARMWLGAVRLWLGLGVGVGVAEIGGYNINLWNAFFLLCVFFFETLELFLGPPSYTYPPYGVELNFWIRRVGVWLVECLIQREEKALPSLVSSAENEGWMRDYSGELGIFADNLLKNEEDSGLASEGRSHKKKSHGNARNRDQHQHQSLTERYMPKHSGISWGITWLCKLFPTHSCVSHEMGKSWNNREVGLVGKFDFENLLDGNNNVTSQSPRVFISDDCDTLSSDCWSAVSKVKFFFPKLRDADIVYSLQLIASKEEIEIEKDALKLIASRSDGSLRDAEFVRTEDLCSFGSGTDTVNTVKKLRTIMETSVEPLALMSQLATVITDILAVSKEDMEKLRQALKTLSEAEKQLRVSNDKLTWLTAALLHLAPDQNYLLHHSSTADSSLNRTPLPLENNGGRERESSDHHLDPSSDAAAGEKTPTVHSVFSSPLKSTAEKFRGHIMQAFEAVLESPVTIEITSETKRDTRNNWSRSSLALVGQDHNMNGSGRSEIVEVIESNGRRHQQQKQEEERTERVGSSGKLMDAHSKTADLNEKPCLSLRSWNKRIYQEACYAGKPQEAHVARYGNFGTVGNEVEDGNKKDKATGVIETRVVREMSVDEISIKIKVFCSFVDHSVDCSHSQL